MIEGLPELACDQLSSLIIIIIDKNKIKRYSLTRVKLPPPSPPLRPPPKAKQKHNHLWIFEMDVFLSRLPCGHPNERSCILRKKSVCVCVCGGGGGGGGLDILEANPV